MLTRTHAGYTAGWARLVEPPTPTRAPLAASRASRVKHLSRTMLATRHTAATHSMATHHAMMPQSEHCKRKGTCCAREARPPSVMHSGSRALSPARRALHMPRAPAHRAFASERTCCAAAGVQPHNKCQGLARPRRAAPRMLHNSTRVAPRNSPRVAPRGNNAPPPDRDKRVLRKSNRFS